MTELLTHRSLLFKLLQKSTARECSKVRITFCYQNCQR